jgi:hypothetical protein
MMMCLGSWHAFNFLIVANMLKRCQGKEDGDDGGREIVENVHLLSYLTMVVTSNVDVLYIKMSLQLLMAKHWF